LTPIFGGAILCASRAAIKNACFLKLQTSVLASELFCLFPVTGAQQPSLVESRKFQSALQITTFEGHDLSAPDRLR